MVIRPVTEKNVPFLFTSKQIAERGGGDGIRQIKAIFDAYLCRAQSELTLYGYCHGTSTLQNNKMNLKISLKLIEFYFIENVRD